MADVESPPVAEAPASSPAPIVDVVPPPVQTAEEVAESQQQPTEPTAPIINPVPVTKPASKHDSSVTVAIIATVVIVIALAALATYAYLKQK